MAYASLYGAHIYRKNQLLLENIVIEYTTFEMFISNGPLPYTSHFALFRLPGSAWLAVCLPRLHCLNHTQNYTHNKFLFDFRNLPFNVSGFHNVCFYSPKVQSYFSFKKPRLLMIVSPLECFAKF